MAEEELKYTSDYSGEDTDAILEYADKLRQQTEAEDGDTVQVFDTDGNPHKVAKEELLKKSTLALPSLNDISAFVAINQAGDAVGVMSKQQVATVLGGLTTKKSVNTVEELDNLKTQGMCTINAISDYEQSNGMLVILTVSSSIVCHYFVKYNGTVWSRIYWFNSWTAWRNL